VGAAKGAGIGAKIFASEKEAFVYMKPLALIQPTMSERYEEVYQWWKQSLSIHL
jgi:xylulokinase